MTTPKLKVESYDNLGGINIKASIIQTPQTQFLNLVNFDFTTPMALTKRWGSTVYIPQIVASPITGIFDFAHLNGASYLIVTANTNTYFVNQNLNLFSALRTGLQSGANIYFVSFVDRLFAANGNQFFKWQASLPLSSKYCLPPGWTQLTSTFGGSGSGFSGNVYYTWGYLNERGFNGPVGGSLLVNPAGASAVTLTGFTVPTDFGITAIAIYRTDVAGTVQSLIGYASLGVVGFTDTMLPTSSFVAPTYFFFTMMPRYLEIYQNRLFMSGISVSPSTVWFSDVGEPEGVQVSWNFDVRSNDGDRVTGFRSYENSLVIFKEKSFHYLLGDSPDNFNLIQVSDQYGCLSHRATVVYNNFLLFLDRKGICQFNGSNVEIISVPVEAYFTSMNISAARDNAVAVHFKSRNELWFAIPANGSTFNNLTVVYDYLLQAWTTYQGFNPAVMCMSWVGVSMTTAFYGGYSGQVFNFDPSVFGDNGQGMTCLIVSKFHSDLGQSTEKQFRRLWINSNILGASSFMSLNMFSNYSTAAIVFSTTITLSTFQTRTEFGVSAKSLSIQFGHFSSSETIKFFGYALAERHQRDV